MDLGKDGTSYRWQDQWARIPETAGGRANGRTHGVAVTGSGEVVVFHQADPAVLFFDREGRLLRAWGKDLPGAHGLTLVSEGGVDLLWLTDHDSAAVLKTTLEGEVLMSLPRPEYPAYHDGAYRPTWVAVNEERLGGNGDIWVADGYGSDLVHRFDRGGNYRATITGAEGRSGRFRCPHAVHVLHRRGEPELYIADRGNKRFQVYDVDGRYKEEIGAGILECPCACALHGDLLLVPELNARLTILDERNAHVGVIGDNSSVCAQPGWPDNPQGGLQPGKFNSPHGIALDSAGAVYIVEWIIGGRITRLVPARASADTDKDSRTRQ